MEMPPDETLSTEGLTESVCFFFSFPSLLLLVGVVL